MKVQVLRRFEMHGYKYIDVEFRRGNVVQISRFSIPLSKYTPEREKEIIEDMKKRLWQTSPPPEEKEVYVYIFKHKLEVAFDLPLVIRQWTYTTPRELTPEEIAKIETTLGMKLVEKRKVLV